MNLITIHSFLSWSAQIFAVLTALAAVGAYYTGNIISEKKDTEIAALKPRTLSDTQRATLENILRSRVGTVGFMSRLMDGEGIDYANQLAEVFRQAGWNVVSIAGNHLADLPGRVTTAILDDATMLPIAEMVCQAFNEAGIICGGEIRQGQLPGPLAPQTLYIVIGRKQ
ncbi:hypothetical protein [Ferrovibrio terrae]|uniref:hypothetical protein n=1 Tax=Ferrovibrio terrae TaxID=2594003 RepID=UPI0031382CBD